MGKQELFERTKRGESAIAEAKAQGRDVVEWERYLEALKLEADRLFPAAHEAKMISCNLEEGQIVAVEIASEVLDAEIWLSFRDDFDPGDGKAVFYGRELCVLGSKTPEQLRAIHQAKLGLGAGMKVRQ